MALDQKRQKPRDKIKLNFLTKSEKREEAAVVQRLLKSHGECNVTCNILKGRKIGETNKSVMKQ
jgi:hypothetical protein